MTHHGSDLTERVALARDAAARAGRVLMAHRGSASPSPARGPLALATHGHADSSAASPSSDSVTVDRKGAVDLVTVADAEAEALIVRAIAAAFPGDAVVAEEGSARSATDGAGWRWIIDPLDGTTNFVHGLPNFCVSVALQRHDTLLAGVIEAPALGRSYCAVAGMGAFEGNAALRVADSDKLADALIATGFPYDRRETAAELVPILQRVVERARGVRRMGSAALDLAGVAEGCFGGFWEQRLQIWDIAAGIVLVREAGGQVTDWTGRDHDLGSGDVIASNGRLHEAFRAVLHGRGGAPDGDGYTGREIDVG